MFLSFWGNKANCMNVQVKPPIDDVYSYYRKDELK